MRRRVPVCLRHGVRFVKPRPFYHGGKRRSPPHRCPECVKEAREKVAQMQAICRTYHTARRESQVPVLMIEGDLYG